MDRNNNPRCDGGALGSGRGRGRRLGERGKENLLLCDPLQRRKHGHCRAQNHCVVSVNSGSESSTSCFVGWVLCMWPSGSKLTFTAHFSMKPLMSSYELSLFKIRFVVSIHVKSKKINTV